MKYAAAFAVLAILAVGIAGIATGVGYTASTTTTENDITADYVIVNIGGSFTETFDMEAYKQVYFEDNEGVLERKVAYYPMETIETTDYVAMESKEVKINITGSGTATVGFSAKLTSAVSGATFKVCIYKYVEETKTMVLDWTDLTTDGVDAGTLQVCDNENIYDYYCKIKAYVPVEGEELDPISFGVTFTATAGS